MKPRAPSQFPRGYFGVATAAVRCGVCVETILAGIVTGELPHEVSFGEIAVRAQALNRWFRGLYLEVETPAELPSEAIFLGPSAFSGLYFLYLEGVLQYVGQSVNVPSRVRDHYTSKYFDAAYFLPLPAAELDANERYWVGVLRPVLNRMLLDTAEPSA